MDLAKIRQKAQKEQQAVVLTLIPENPSTPTLSEVQGFEKAPSVIMPKDSPPDIVQPKIDQMFFDTPKSERCQQPAEFVSQPFLNQHKPLRDPLETILAGRIAAGCDEDQPLVLEEFEQVKVADYLEFLCFRVSDEFYGINIMDIKEIIKPRETTEIPRSPSFVLGVVSLRGIIIPIIDMLDRLGLSRERLTGRERVVVVKRAEGLSGLLVDEIIQVVRIPAGSLEAAPSVLDGIDRDFVSNIGRADGKMIIILNLECIADINLY